MKPSRLFPDQTAIRLRHDALIRGSAREKYLPFIVAALMAAVAVFALFRLEFSFARLGAGIVQLGTFLGLMVPPSPGTQPLASGANGRTTLLGSSPAAEVTSRLA